MRVFSILIISLLYLNVYAESPYFKFPTPRTAYGENPELAVENALILQDELRKDFKKGFRSKLLQEAKKWRSDIQFCQEILFPTKDLIPVKIYLVDENEWVYKVSFEVALNGCY